MTPAEARKAFKERKAESLAAMQAALTEAHEAYSAAVQLAAVSHASRMVAAALACRETIEAAA
jgi:hypothetical protein